jgi:Bax protein
MRACEFENQLDEGFLDKTKMYIAAAALGVGTLGANIADHWSGDNQQNPSSIQDISLQQSYDMFDKKTDKDGDIHPNYPKTLMGKEGKDLKTTFTDIIIPKIVENNKKIKNKRERILSISKNKNPSAQDKEFLEQLMVKYKTNDIEELLKRVDVVPVSIAITQAAVESGWGTSRFAVKANALFGQKTTADKSIDSETDKYAAFENFDASIEAYMRNINTHPAYKDFRNVRAKVHKKAANVNDLLNTLTKYSTRGQDYVKQIKSVMRANGFDKIDNKI